MVVQGESAVDRGWHVLELRVEMMESSNAAVPTGE